MDVTRWAADLLRPEQARDQCGGGCAGTEIWRYDIATGDETMILATPTDLEGQEVTDAEESPDASQIVYAGALGPGVKCRLYVLEADGSGEPAMLASESPDGPIEWQEEPTFSPDGSTLAYLHTSFADDAASTTIRLIDLTTMRESVLYAPATPEPLHGLEWSVDGTLLLVAGGPSSDRATSVEARTGAPTVIASAATTGFTTSTADGRSVSGVSAAGTNGPEPAVITTWRDTNATTTKLPIDMSFALGLTIADCAYAHVG